MKTNTLTLLEIAIVLCSVLLVALPVIAAEQSVGKVTGSATASEDNFVLGVYGNANEDDTIDMRDLTYVKLIFFGKKPETELADAKYDGKINPLDFIQIKLIIVGKEREITFVDSMERIVTVEKPLNRIVVTFRQCLEMVRSVKVETDRIVGVERHVQYSGGGKWEENTWGVDYSAFFPEFQDVPTVGYIWGPDCEAILNLNPDAVLLMASTGGRWGGVVDAAQDVLELAGIPVIRLYGGVYGKKIPEEVKKFGYIFDKRKEADEFLDWYEENTNLIAETVEGISEEDKPKVYSESCTKYGTSRYAIENAGGRDIFDGASGSIDPEAVIERDPDIIVKRVRSGGYHLDADDTAKLEEAREEVMSRPELENVKAVKDGRVYVISEYITSTGPASGGSGFFEVVYMAKWFHPELFEDLDPKAIHQEYLTRFQLDFDLDEHGVFVYPPLES